MLELVYNWFLNTNSVIPCRDHLHYGFTNVFILITFGWFVFEEHQFLFMNFESKAFYFFPLLSPLLNKVWLKEGINIIWVFTILSATFISPQTATQNITLFFNLFIFWLRHEFQAEKTLWILDCVKVWNYHRVALKRCSTKRNKFKFTVYANPHQSSRDITTVL